MSISADRLEVIEQYPTISDTLELVSAVKHLRDLLAETRCFVDDYDTLNRIDAAIRGEARAGVH